MPKLTLTEAEVKLMVEGYDIGTDELEGQDEDNPELAAVTRKILKAAGDLDADADADLEDDTDDDEDDEPDASADA